MNSSILKGACVASAVTLLGVGCRAAAGNAVTLTDADRLTTVHLSPGQVLTVRLAGNMTTGYRWDVSGVDDAVLVQEGEANYQEAESDKVGGGGEFTFEFKAQRPGTTQLKLVYHRPWENDVPPIDTFEVTLVVD